MALIIPQNYHPKLNILETQQAIKTIKDSFQLALASSLSLTRVSAPFFVFPETGLNDDLSGVERAVRFGVKDLNEREVVIVHSLAKWKRMALVKYQIPQGQGLYTDMNAIRRDEELDNLHSIYVDQWDWEKIIPKAERTNETLENTVKTIYGVFKTAEAKILSVFPQLTAYLPDDITFVDSQELEDRYPDLTPKQRENEICKQHKAVFLKRIGGALRSGKPHDLRAPDYDDWQLNGDILFWYPPLAQAFEVSSMGIRVDETAMREQLKLAHCEDRAALPFHRSLLNGELPYTIAGGLGQSRICMFLLNKAHIGEVQASVWPDEMIEACRQAEIYLL